MKIEIKEKMDKSNSKLITAGDKNSWVGLRQVQRHCQNAAWMQREGECERKRVKHERVKRWGVSAYCSLQWPTHGKRI